MQIKLLVSAADEKITTLDGIPAFASLAGIQASPLDTAEMADVTGADFFIFNKKLGQWVVITNGHLAHEVHADEHGVKIIGKGGGVFAGGDVFDCVHDSIGC